MSEHFFAVGKPVSRKIEKTRDRIAREVGGAGCGFISFNRASDRAGDRTSYGFCPNLGEPFDSRTARLIVEAWAKAGV